ncbi:hypothetical protein TVAG_458840 [Trichomonas vaginalis G3]|uniref:Importin N-terminal domain-containing protein n=1 Tax=Trichomonas vaginalis (strain ATCC PRA-98 / G3) TaxID=412133 RepID=A2E689_TRIV3|nr:armadillo (ARM) repeat-containing protein family [Trichomonas vaginalis G3]EAY11812.1 hypothetical protein TVAG_458840 [Trichomonas vaginalis G3]KAI5534218.1 armadillo (ARM) repeat-containing protein family [Trichomonas vaginalis G3]|eukprot:XP_001324035.1 hypothetical protein [Trichomonas vaginalis G3]
MDDAETIGNYLKSKDPQKIDVESISLRQTPATLHDFAVKCSNSDASYLNGTVFLMNKSLFSLYATQNQENKSLIRNSLIEISKTNLDDLDSSTIVQLTSNIFRTEEFNWPELIDFILESLFTTHKGRLFIKITSLLKAFYDEAHLSKAYNAITNYMASQDPRLQLSLIILLNNMNNSRIFDDNIELFDNMWSAIINISKNLPQRISSCVSTTAELFKSLPSISQLNSKSCSNIVLSANDFDSLKPIIPFLHIINTDLLSIVITKLLILIETHETYSSFVLDIITYLCSQENEFIPDEKLEIIYSKLLDSLPNKPAMALFVPYCPFISEYFDEEEFYLILKELLISDDELFHTFGLLCLENIGDHSEYYSLTIPSKVISLVIRTLPNKLSIDTIKSLIKSGLFDHEKSVYDLANHYYKISNDKECIFDLFRLYLKTPISKDLTIDAIYDFAYLTLLKSQDLREIGNCLSLISGTSLFDCDCFAPCAEDYIPYILKLFNNNVMIEYALENLSYCLRCEEELAKDVCESRMNQIMKFAEIYPSSISSVILICCLLKNDKCLEKCIDMIKNIKDPELLYEVSVNSAENLEYPDDSKFAFDIFQILIDQSLVVCENDKLNCILDSIIDMMNNYLIDESLLHPLYISFMSMKHPVFNAHGFAVFSDEKTRILSFLANYAKYNEESKSEVSNTICSWFSLSKFSMMSCFTDVIAELVEFDVIGDEYKRFYDILFSNLSSDETLDDSRILRAMMCIVRIYTESIEIDLLTAHLINMWYETEEISGPWRSSLGTSILELCALGADAMTEDIEDVLVDFPFTSDFCCCDIACESLVEIVKNDKFDDLVPSAAKSMCDVAINNDAYLCKMGILKDTVHHMKEELKNIFDRYGVLVDEFRKIYQEGKETDLTKYNRMIDDLKLNK